MEIDVGVQSNLLPDMPVTGLLTFSEFMTQLVNVKVLALINNTIFIKVAALAAE